MPTRQLLVTLAALGALACARPRLNDPVILALGDAVVRRSDFERHVKALETRGGGPLEPAAREALLDQFLEDRALVLEARARGLLDARADALGEAEGVQKLLAAAVPAREVSEDELMASYAARPDQFQRAENVTLRQILVPTLNEARDVLRRLQKDPRSFERLARTSSRAPEADAGGLMGSFARGELPAELEARAFELAAGETSGVVESPLGFHILRVESREAARQLEFEECRGRIRAELLRQGSERGVHEFVRELMARTRVNHEAAKAPADRS
jgi:parvulin-like peptidyl-prolyl isomerase